MSDAAVRGWTSRTEYNHSNDCPRKHHAPDCGPIVVFFEPRAIKTGEDYPPMRLAKVLSNSEQGAQLTRVDWMIEVSSSGTQAIGLLGSSPAEMTPLA